MFEGVVVVGAGGHAKVCIELLFSMGESVHCCVGGSSSEQSCAGVPVLVGDHHLGLLRSKGFSRLFVAVGDNRLRARLADSATELGFVLVNAISPAAVISRSARLGAGVAVMAGAVINAETQIDDLAIVNAGAIIDHECRIGYAAHVGPRCGLAGNVVLGSQSFLGVGCCVIPERVIGKDVIVGAGSVVITDMPDNVTAVGVPARVIKIRN